MTRTQLELSRRAKVDNVYLPALDAVAMKLNITLVHHQKVVDSDVLVCTGHQQFCTNSVSRIRTICAML